MKIRFAYVDYLLGLVDLYEILVGIRKSAVDCECFRKVCSIGMTSMTSQWMHWF